MLLIEKETGKDTYKLFKICSLFFLNGSWYLEKIRYLEIEKLEIYKQLDEGKFVVQTNKGKFKAVLPDMKLEQTINRSQKSAGGIVGQMK